MNDKIKNEVLTVCDVKINYCPKVKPSERPVLKKSADIYKMLIDRCVFPPETIEYKEYFKIILFNQACKVLGISHISEGGTNQVLVDIKHIMQAAILSNATGMTLCHNHPSGNCNPSHQDDLITKKIKDACNIMDITVLDHIIISPENYYSYADEGRI
ncbi:MAG: JAB domain-containing protein [Tannerella sp.]|jgi:DNA repair protein RadC|nr:JAB domain-containing protein [Tannerella sp.]